MEHTAKILEDSIEHVDTDTLAFSTVCCDDPATLERHTVHGLRGQSEADLRAVLMRLVRSHAERHLGTESAHSIVKSLVRSSQGLCHTCSRPDPLELKEKNVPPAPGN
jgi:hypothetical protein